MFDHDLHYRVRQQDDRNLFAGGRPLREIETELTVREPKEGIFEAHVFNIILQKVESLQRRVQGETIRGHNERVSQINTELGEAYTSLDTLEEDDPEVGEISANIHDLQTELQNLAENKEMASRQRILNVEQTKKGINYAESFYLTKDIKSKRGIAKLVNAEGGEITKDEEIQKTLEQHYESTVGRDFTPEMSLMEFLEKYGVELPTLAEAEQNMLMEDVTDEELKYALSSAKTSSAPGPSGQSIAIFKYLYSQVPKLMLATINQLILIPGLIKLGAFAWLLGQKVVFILKPGKVPDRVQNLRPLSLLESMYKILGWQGPWTRFCTPSSMGSGLAEAARLPNYLYWRLYGMLNPRDGLCSYYRLMSRQPLT